jgi:UDP-glucose:(heptosyl)LPS alpha-1,3-glucosyltransferase
VKIGFQIERLDRARGGAETYVHRFAQALLAVGHEVHLFAEDFVSAPQGAITHIVMRQGLTRAESDWRFARASGRAARRANLDVVVAVGRTFGANVLQPHGGSLWASRRQNLRLIRNPFLRGGKRVFDWFNPRIRTQGLIEARQYAAFPPPEVVAISRMVQRDIRQFHHVPDERLHVVYNGVDLERFQPAACKARRAEARRAWNLADGETCFLIVAHNFRLKGVRELIEAAAWLDRKKSWRVVVVGKGRAWRYQARAEELGCSDRVVFAGPMDDVVAAYAASDVYVQPTWYDPCSLVVLEALACGRPVITTRLNGASELMEDGREGLVLDTPAEVERLADAMSRLMDGDRRAAMGRAARETAEQHSLERNFRQMMAVFEQAVARKEALKG